MPGWRQLLQASWLTLGPVWVHGSQEAKREILNRYIEIHSPGKKGHEISWRENLGFEDRYTIWNCHAQRWWRCFHCQGYPLTHQSAKQPIDNLRGSYYVHTSAAVIRKCKIGFHQDKYLFHGWGDRMNKGREQNNTWDGWGNLILSLISHIWVRNKNTRSSQSEQFTSSNFQKLRGFEAFLTDIGK